MTDFEPPSDRVYDPYLGEERDAFPGEVVKPEEEKTMQRLMRQGEEEFKRLYAEVAQSGQLSQVELNGILKAGKIRAERERQKYLEAIRSNPANIIGNILRNLDPQADRSIFVSLNRLDSSIREVSEEVEEGRSTDKMGGRGLGSTVDYVGRVLDRRGFNGAVIASYQSSQNILIDEDKVTKMLKELGAFPSPEITTASQLCKIIREAGNKAGSGKPVYDGRPDFNRIVQAKDIPANAPGLEGVTVRLSFVNLSTPEVRNIYIQGTPQAWARIVDIGGYIPYSANP